MEIIKIIGIIVISEIVLAFLFSTIAQILYKKIGLDFTSIFKGVIERLFLMFSLYKDYPHALTFFSAIKLASRLKHEEKESKDKEAENRYNDFYLTGNLISVSVAIAYVLLIRYFLK
jgi:hypothetical protein